MESRNGDDKKSEFLTQKEERLSCLSGSSDSLPDIDELYEEVHVTASVSSEMDRLQEEARDAVTRAVANESDPVVAAEKVAQRWADEEESLWEAWLKTVSNGAWVAPVEHFTTAPFARNWKSLARDDLIVELPHPYEDKLATVEGEAVYALGKIIGYAGYYALIKYLQAPGDTSEPEYTWILYLNPVLKPFGYCYKKTLLIHPITESRQPATAIIEFLRDVISMAVFPQGQPLDSLKGVSEPKQNAEFARCRSRFELAEYVEAADLRDSGRYVLGIVAVRAGDRIYVKYLRDKSKDNDGFWFHQTSPDVHKLGWCQNLKIPLFRGDSIDLVFSSNLADKLDYPEYPASTKIVKNLVFEMRHPCHPHKIVPGYCVRPLKHGWIVAMTDWANEEERVEVIIHVTSEYLLKPGFCKEHGISLDYKSKVNDFWGAVNMEGKDVLFEPPKINRPPNKFIQGAKLETTDAVQPFVMLPGTIVQVAGRLLRIFLDGRDRSDPKAFQWVSCDSGTIYPAGYSELMGLVAAGLPDEPDPKDHFLKKTK